MVTVISAQSATTTITVTTELNDQNTNMTSQGGLTTETPVYTRNSTDNITTMFTGSTMNINNTSTFTPGTTNKGESYYLNYS